MSKKNVLIEVLRLVYCVDVQNIDKLAEKLLVVADKYQFQRLEVLAINIFAEKI